MIRPTNMTLRRMKGVPKYYLLVVKLLLIVGIATIFFQPLLYAPINFAVRESEDPAIPVIPDTVLNIVTPENATLLLDGEIDAFRDRPSQRLPKIIHQIYANGKIPSVYVPYIQSWVNNHPDYEYWLWDDVSSRMLIEKYYPKFLPLFDAYCHDLFRSDITRYFLLHKFGGMYMDMDYVAYKNLEPLFKDQQCMLVEETRLQARMIYRVSDMVMNSFMASVPGHPYMNYIINSLPSRATCVFGKVLDSTGPILIYKARKQYLEITRCNPLESCYVHILPSDKMMNSWDKDAVRVATKNCKKNTSLTPLQMESCKFLQKLNFEHKRIKKEDAYADHLFLHLGNQGKKFKATKRVDIAEIVPNVVIPSRDKL